MTMREKVRAATMVAVFALVLGAHAQQMPANLRVGAINFFGAQGMDTTPIVKKLSIQSGQMVPTATMDKTKDTVSADVHTAMGMSATDVNIVCCDAPETVDFYIGLPGVSYRPLQHDPAPTGEAALPPEAIALYDKDSNLEVEAIQHGVSQEDWSKGYALSDYPPAKQVQMKMRAYALAHTPELERALREAKEAKQRQAAATLLGYSERSAGQVATLTHAANDSDADVRNNATRALSVMLYAGPLKGLDATPFVAMLYSGSWSDRNKASLLLDAMTVTRNPALLNQLRGALGPLEDGAEWQSAGHAYMFLAILGRIGGIEETQLQALIKAGAKDQIIAAAKATKKM